MKPKEGREKHWQESEGGREKVIRGGFEISETIKNKEE